MTVVANAPKINTARKNILLNKKTEQIHLQEYLRIRANDRNRHSLNRIAKRAR